MEKRLLVTISEDPNALHGVRFLCRFFRNAAALRITLLYLYPQDRTANGQALYDMALGHAESILHLSDFREDQITLKRAVHRLQHAEDLLHEAEAGGYTALVLGRRGLSWLERTITKGVEDAIFRERTTLPLWVCRPPDKDRGDHVLACIDGSASSCRMLEHVATMLSGEDQHLVTLLHVVHPSYPEPDTEEKIFEKGYACLESKGLPVHNVRARSIEGEDTVRAILKHAANDRYSVVAVGRTGSGQSQGLLRSFFLGSVSMGLLRELQGITLWMCQ